MHYDFVNSDTLFAVPNISSFSAVRPTPQKGYDLFLEFALLINVELSFLEPRN